MFKKVENDPKNDIFDSKTRICKESTIFMVTKY